MSGQDLMNELAAKVGLLDTALRKLGERGRSHAQAERDYRVALAQKILIERDKGTPVTIIPTSAGAPRKSPPKIRARLCRDEL